ncbi:MAG: M23 family metallopeptidase [Pseudomonadota bacterium]
MKVLDPSVPRFADWRGQAYAYDLLGLDPLGLTAPVRRPRDPARYAIFAAPVHAPCEGEVLSAETTLPDLPVPEMDRENLMGNHVLLRCGEVAILLAHLRQGSVAVAPGDRLARGDKLGEVGNSGHSSEPHLHIHAQRPPAPDAAPVSGEPLPLRLEDRWLTRNARLAGRDW